MPGIRLAAASRIYRTEPQELKEQPWFANQVVELRCDQGLTPEGLLDALLAIEADMGRVRETGETRFGPRLIDLDLLLFGRETRAGERLTLPHPRMLGRAFVLVPLLEIAPDLVLPDGQPIAPSLERLDYEVEETTIRQA